jgi:parallel beta-helix repeat protein
MAQLGRIDDTIADPATGLPLSGVSVKVRKQGALVDGAQAGKTTGQAITVKAPGALTATGDVRVFRGGVEVDVGPGLGTTFTVTVVAAAAVTLTWGGGASATFADEDRLVWSVDASIYEDSIGQDAKANPLTTDTNGRVEAWAAGNLYDLLVSGGGVATEYVIADFWTGGNTQASNTHDGATAVGAVNDTTRALATKGAKAHSFRVSGVEVGYVDKDGWYEPAGASRVNAAVYATGGAGTVGDPWTGWEAAVAANTLVYFPKGYYATTSEIALNDYSVIEGDGWDSIIDVSGTNSTFTSSSKTGIVIKNIKLDLADQTLGNISGITLTGTTNSRIENVFVLSASNRAIGLSTGSCDNVIRDCRIEDTGLGTTPGSAYGIHLTTNCCRNKILNNVVLRSGWSGIMLQGTQSGQGSNDNLVHGNTVIENGTIATGGYGIFVTYFSHRNIISNNHVEGSGMNFSGITGGAQSAIQVNRGCNRTTISDNTITRIAGYGIELDHSDNCIIQGNSIIDVDDPGIRASDAFNLNVSGNFVEKAAGGGVRLRNETEDFSLLAAGFAQIGATSSYKHDGTAGVNFKLTSGVQLVRAMENGTSMDPWVPSAGCYHQSAPAGTTTINCYSTGGNAGLAAAFTVGDTVVVTNADYESINSVTTVASVDDAVQITVNDAQIVEPGYLILKLSSTGVAGTVDSIYYIDRKTTYGTLYVHLSDATAPGDNEITSGSGCQFASVVDNMLRRNGTDGVWLEGSSHCTITGNVCRENGIGAGGSGIRLSDDDSGGTIGATYNTIIGNSCVDNHTATEAIQAYGIRTDDANCDNNLVVGNVCIGNVTGQVSFQTAGNNVQANNMVA